jgi:hypothetical protein
VVGGDYTSGAPPASSETVTDEGIHQVLLTVTDFAGNVSTTQATVKIDKTPPVVSCSTLTLGTVWPPNHKLVPWVTSVAVTDVGDIDKQSGEAGFVLVSATSSEPDNGRGDGNTTADIQGFVIGTPDTEGFIRAERSGEGHGRVYSLVYEGRDGAGNVAACTVLTRLVPHDARDHDDGGADVDSDKKDPKGKKDTKKATDSDKGKKKS